MNTVDATLHRPAPPGDRGGAPERTFWLFLPVIVVLLAGLFSASFVVLPYYAMAPGGATGVEDLVTVGEGVRTYDPKGEVFLATVSLRRITALEAVIGWLDPATDILPEEEVVPPSVKPSDFREFNLAQMDNSKLTAQIVALRYLGYDVTESGTGALVIGVVEGTPADGVIEPGDVIVAVDGEPVEVLSDAVDLLGAHAPGDAVRLSVRRASVDDTGTVEEVEVTLSHQQEDPSAPLLGVRMQTDDVEYDFPFDVKINSDRIGGPSAGLAYTLELIDVLTPGELTGGRKVAATGTIGDGGIVGLVGGVAQKAVAVDRAGADLFLVPRGEEVAARKLVGGDLDVVPVDDLEDALTALSKIGGNGLALGTDAGTS